MLPITTQSACFFTQQLFLIGTRDTDGAPRFAPISWISFTAGPPCCLVISISGINRKKQTAQNIERTGILSATVVTPDLLPFAEQCNRAPQSDAAFNAPALTYGTAMDVPLLAEAKWSYECKVIQSLRIGSCDTYFASFAQVNVRKDVQQLDFTDLRAIDPVVYSPNHYLTIGEHLGQIGDFAK